VLWSIPVQIYGISLFHFKKCVSLDFSSILQGYLPHTPPRLTGVAHPSFADLGVEFFRCVRVPCFATPRGSGLTRMSPKRWNDARLTIVRLIRQREILAFLALSRLALLRVLSSTVRRLGYNFSNTLFST